MPDDLHMQLAFAIQDPAGLEAVKLAATILHVFRGAGHIDGHDVPETTLAAMRMRLEHWNQTAPTAAPETPTAAPETPTAAPETPTAAPETPTAAPETPTAAPEDPAADEWREQSAELLRRSFAVLASKKSSPWAIRRAQLAQLKVLMEVVESL